MSTAVKLASRDARNIPFQEASLDIWDKKYRLSAKDGTPIDRTMDDTYKRVARALADVEKEAVREHWYERFLWALRRGAIPAGRVTSNAGALEHKPATSTINCTVSGTIHDSMDDILRKVHEAGLTLKAGCGIGYSFSTLRPRGAYVSGAGAYTSGPLSFMDIYDKMCFTVSSAGGRRGAQMGTFDVGHPDVMEFIRAKRESGRLRQFNLSLLITDAFMEAVREDREWKLAFPVRAKEIEGIDTSDPAHFLWREWPDSNGYVRDEAGLVLCKVYKTLPARRMWDVIMSSTYDFAEPGFVLIDRVNEMNNNWWCENIRATNPCVTADTRLATQFGLVRIGDLYASGADLSVTVDRRAMGEHEPGVTTRPAVPAFKTAESADIWRVQTEDGYEIKATEWHDFYTSRGKLKLRDLVAGDELLIQSGKGQFGQEGSADLGELLGLLTGDGHFTNRGKGEQAAVINLWGGDRAYADHVAAYVSHLIARLAESPRHYRVSAVAVPQRNLIMIRSVLLARLLAHYGFTAETKLRVPEVVWRGSEECVRGYLRALFQCDGTVQRDDRNAYCTIRLASSHPELLKDVQILLANFGIYCRILKRREAGERYLPDGKGGKRAFACQADYELLIGSESRDRFMHEIGFLSDEKATKYRECAAQRSSARKVSFTSRIARIELCGREAVFDTTQPDRNNLIFNGLVTGNCGEQPLPPYGSCWTGSMRINTNFGLIRTEDAHALVQQGKSLSIGVDDVFSGNRTELRPCTLVCNGEREVFEVAFDNGQRIELTADHRVYTPSGWREVRELGLGNPVHVQARELASLPLVDEFYVGALKYLLPRYDGEDLVVTRRSRRAFLKPILDLLRVNYTERTKGLRVSRNHPVVREVERLDLAKASNAVLEGYAYAADATSARYKGRRAVYGDERVCRELADVLERLTRVRCTPIHHRSDSYRLLLPALTVVVPQPASRALDLEYGLYGWLLADGWLTQSAGLVFSDQDDRAMQLLAPRFKMLTGTDGDLRRSYTGQRRDVYSIACYRSDAIRRLRDELGLQSYRSRDIRIPEKIFRATEEQQASFLAAVFCADGSVSAEKPLVQLVSASHEWLQDVQLLLLNFGVHGSIHSSTSKGNVFYTLLLQQRDCYQYYRYIGFPFNSTKQAKLERHLADKERWREHPEQCTARVSGVRSIGLQKVYDIEEYSTHTLIVNGVVVHNCLLGSVNLTSFVRDPFGEKAHFDWDEYHEVVKVFTRMLDNVVEVNGLPLEQQQEEIRRKRRHGMGFLGLGSTITMLRMKYGSPEAVAFTERVSKELALAGWEEALELAREKGPAPIMSEEFEVTPEMLRKRPELARDGIRAGDRLPGRLLHARYSRYMQRVAEAAPELVNRLAEVGARFTHHSSIAPTGTISLSLANNASNGIEPTFAHHYFRNVIREGRKSKERIDVFSFELLAYRELVNSAAMPGATAAGERLPEYFSTTDDVTPKQHVDIQAAAQKWVDSSISKTANVPTDYRYEDFKDIYLYAHEQGLKGCTTFRFNPDAFQGVLVKEDDLKNTTYVFTLQDGSELALKGDEMVEYDGEMHTAANLFDALKEGYYGKF